MNMEKKKEFLINAAYWALVLSLGYLACRYVIPVIVPFIIGTLVARLVVEISRRVRCPKKWMRVLLTLLIYGGVGTLAGLAVVRLVDFLSGVVTWLPEVYEKKLLPLGEAASQVADSWAEKLHPSMAGAVDFAGESLAGALKGLVSTLSSYAVSLMSGAARGLPRVLLGGLAMVFSTVFVSNDYEQLRNFAADRTPEKLKALLKQLKGYLTGTLLVVLRSYLLIMLLTFTELSILFSLFGIGDPLAKAAVIAVLDILPILGTGTVLIPWAAASLVLGNARLGVELLVIYGIVAVVRNYAEPRIVGAQLGLHPIISLISMFVGLRLFGFWGMLGLPVTISFAWKQRQEKE